MVFGIAGFVLLFISILIKRFLKLEGRLSERIYFYITGGLIALNYLAFLVLSNIDLGLAFAPYIGA